MSIWKRFDPGRFVRWTQQSNFNFFVGFIVFLAIAIWVLPAIWP